MDVMITLATIVLIITIAQVARFIEGVRDGEMIRDAISDRSKLWHFLKYPQYGLWVLIGRLWPLTWSIWAQIILLGVMLGLAWYVFEKTLETYR